MKKIITFLYALTFCMLSFAENGAYADKIYFGVKMSNDVAVQDVVEGISDFYMDEVPGNLFQGLDKATRDKLDVYTVPALSWDFILNPIPNKAPYQVKKNGKTKFNPFAIKDVRFALNNLINRKYVVDEILSGAGIPAMTQATTGQPNAWKIDLIAQKMGITVEGNKSKAIEDIDRAMKRAAELPENKGRLVKDGNFWAFDGEAITLRFVIRVDDPEGRLKLGHYFSDLLEEAGLKVEKLLWDRVKSVKSVYMQDPANFDWNIYTEGWGAGSTYVYWRVPTVQHLSTKFNNMPGRGEPSWWNYQNEEIDALASDVMNGNILTVDEYWDKIEKMTELGLGEAIRVFVSISNSYYIANKDKFKERMYYGLGTGIDDWGLVNAKTTGDELKIVQYSAAGGLFMKPWDPIGVSGFSDVYTRNITQNLFEMHLKPTPLGTIAEVLAKLQYSKSAPYRDKDGTIKGKIPVPDDAEFYNHKTKKFEKIKPGTKAVGEAKFKITMGTWHHGRKFDINDYIYASAFVSDWSYKDDDNDKEYNAQYAIYHQESLENIGVGSRIDSKDEITVWYNYNYPVSKLSNLGSFPSVKVHASPSDNLSIPWEVIEPIAKLVTEGSASGTVYGLTEKEGVNSIDIKSPSFLEDMKAKLKELIDRKHVPHILVGKVSEEQAVKNYQDVLDWIEKYNHAVIGNGPYMLTKINAKTGFVELTAVRDGAYPFKQGAFDDILNFNRLRVDDVETPDFAMAGDELEFNINISELNYPSDKAKLATKGTVKLILIAGETEKEIDAKYIGNGKFRVTVTEDVSAELESGTYLYVITATLDGLFVDTKTGNFEIY